jgi:tetratricopeptide (TPR) repeat protein
VLFPIGTMMAERLAYTPSLFVCIAASAMSWRLVPRVSPRAVAISAAVIAAAASARTFAQNRVWRDDATLVRAQVESAPRSAKAHLNLASNLSESGDFAAAVSELETALRIAPDFAWSWYELGDVRERMGSRDAALEAWARALEIDPNVHDARGRSIQALLDLGRRERAVAQMTELVARAPENPLVRPLIDRLWTMSDEKERAAAHADLERGLTLARQHDEHGALGPLQRAFRTFALDERDRRTCLDTLCSALHATDKPRIESAWRSVARALE